MVSVDIDTGRVCASDSNGFHNTSSFIPLTVENVSGLTTHQTWRDIHSEAIYGPNDRPKLPWFNLPQTNSNTKVRG
jgi:hypothetical protein